jgi:hypothetical protein
MSDQIKPSAEWETKNVVKRLRKATSPGKPAAVQVFLKDRLSLDDLNEKAKELVSYANASLNLPAGSVKLGKVFRAANSFSMSSDVPDAFDLIAKRGEVKTILDSAQSDILPKPRNAKDVP